MVEVKVEVQDFSFKCKLTNQNNTGLKTKEKMKSVFHKHPLIEKTLVKCCVPCGLHLAKKEDH